MKISYDLFFESCGTTSITKYRYNLKENAISKCKELNEKLLADGYMDREYVVYKVTKEEVYR